MSSIHEVVRAVAAEAFRAFPTLVRCSDSALDGALQKAATLLQRKELALLDANAEDLKKAEDKLPGGSIERLRLDARKLASMAEALRTLAGLPHIERLAGERILENGLRIQDQRTPVGVIGAIFEARANVTLDIAAQFLKSRNAGVLRSGSAGIGTAVALVEEVIRPALEASGIDPAAIGFIPRIEHEGAEALVSIPDLVPLVIIRGSGKTTGKLARIAAASGVRTLAHAQGGGVLFIHSSADQKVALWLIESSLDSLAVCNRLNLLLVDRDIWETFVPQALRLLQGMGISPSMPPHDHPLGYEWATDENRQATVTVAPVGSVGEAVNTANQQTPAIAAAIATSDEGAALQFLGGFHGTGAFWNVSTRWLDGFRLTSAPETGINVDHVPGPRGPVTYRDLFLRKYVVTGDGTQLHS